MKLIKGNIKQQSIRIILVYTILLVLVTIPLAQMKVAEFKAEGLTVQKRIPVPWVGGSSQGSAPIAVKVSFDLLPTHIYFRLPAFPTLVSENGLMYCNNYTETYDPDALIGGDDGYNMDISFEVMQDRENRYARMWIERQSDARIVVRVRGALCDKNYVIAHTEIPSGSPYGDGDWADEWYYIYPDGNHIRHVRIYTGLASQSRPFGFDRRYPDVIHEFQESTPVWHDRTNQRKPSKSILPENRDKYMHCILICFTFQVKSCKLQVAS